MASSLVFVDQAFVYGGVDDRLRFAESGLRLRHITGLHGQENFLDVSAQTATHGSVMFSALLRLARAFFRGCYVSQSWVPLTLSEEFINGAFC